MTIKAGHTPYGMVLERGGGLDLEVLTRHDTTISRYYELVALLRRDTTNTRGFGLEECVRELERDEIEAPHVISATRRLRS